MENTEEIIKVDDTNFIFRKTVPVTVVDEAFNVEEAKEQAKQMKLEIDEMEVRLKVRGKELEKLNDKIERVSNPEI